jgi:hypothetical protein
LAYTAFSSTVTGEIVAVVANEKIEDADGRRRKVKGAVTNGSRAEVA